jgi:nitronate monooxygenase
MERLLMDLHTSVCDLLECDLPIVLAGMGGVARSELVAAVGEAGGFGFLGMVREPPELITAEIAAVRAHSQRPFGVNLIPAATQPDLLEAELAACLSAKVPVAALFWDLSVETVKRLRGAGVLVVCQVGSADEARAAEDAGADILIAQGVEAGGHVRGLTPLHSLLTEVVPAVDCPVLAAGGLADGGDLAKVMALGAQGGVFGTAFLATRESFAHDYHKARIVEAAAGDTIHTCDFHINWPPNSPVRVLPNSVTKGVRGDPMAGGEPTVIGHEGRRPIYLFSTDSPLRDMSGDFEAMALYAGEGSGRIRDIVSASDRLRTIADVARVRLAEVRTSPTTLDRHSAAAPLQGDADYIGRVELAAEMNVLLEAERAGARVAARLTAEAPDGAFKSLARAIHADEIRWCKVLFRAVNDLGATPSEKVGDFYEAAMAIDGPEARLAFVNRGQGWVAKKLRSLIPRLRDVELRNLMTEMLEAHVGNIDAANAALEARGAPPRQR